MVTAYFAAGCFWGVQHYMNVAPGVLSTEVGYMGGQILDPIYKDVKKGETGHYEVIKIEFNPLITSYIDLCKLFFEIHDPGQDDGQGIDIGSQYLSAIFYTSLEQKKEAEGVIELLKSMGHKVVTSVKPAMNHKLEERFFPAEDYHQHYFEKNSDVENCHFRIKKF